MKIRILFLMAVTAGLTAFAAGCAEKPEPLPKLPPPEIPETLSKENPIKQGMNLVEVRDILGKPNGEMRMGNIVIWRYDRGTVEFEEGIVIISSIMSEYAYAKHQALKEQMDIMNALVPDTKAQKKQKKKEAAQVAAAQKEEEKQEKETASSAEKKQIEDMTDSIVSLLEQSGQVDKDSMMGKASRKMIGKMVEKELRKMPEDERKQLLSQYKGATDVMQNITNSLYRSFQEIQ